MQVRYNNTLLNQEIVALSYNDFKGSYSSDRYISRFILTHPVGSQASKCLFDPNDPSTVVFTINQNAGAIVGLVFGAIFMFVGVIWIVAAIVSFTK
jgi:hypothetical protein